MVLILVLKVTGSAVLATGYLCSLTRMIHFLVPGTTDIIHCFFIYSIFPVITPQDPRRNRTMKLSSLAVVTPLLFGISSAWQVDNRCLHRVLEEDAHAMFLEEEASVMDAYNDVAVVPDVSSSLRGAEDRRDLSSSPTFMLKMYWEQGYCWQEEWIERKWCMSCEGTTCGQGEFLEVQPCDSTKAIQKFIYVPVSGSSGGQLRTSTQNLCLERISGSVWKLNTCRTTNQGTQILEGIETDGSRFELHPEGSSKECLTNNDHHPKPFEKIYSTSCDSARWSKTSNWSTYMTSSPTAAPPTKSPTKGPTQPTSSTVLNLRPGECSVSSPCVKCQGDCDSDSECSSGLSCFQRTSTQTVPGCTGSGSPGRDYCYKKSSTPTKSPTKAPTSSTILNLRSGECSVSLPCVKCQGDCDSDSECKSGLKCFQRSANSTQAVPGCSGSGSPGRDYCY